MCRATVSRLYQEMIQKRPCKRCQVACEKAESMAAGCEAACAPHSVDVGFHPRREVIVDNVGQHLDVQASSSNVSCHQHLGCAILEGVQGCLHTCQQTIMGHIQCSDSVLVHDMNAKRTSWNTAIDLEHHCAMLNKHCHILRRSHVHSGTGNMARSRALTR